MFKNKKILVGVLVVAALVVLGVATGVLDVGPVGLVDIPDGVGD